MKRKYLALFLALALLSQFSAVLAAEALGLKNFQQINPYQSGQFTDVEAGAWYESGVETAYRLGLMKGSSPTAFSVTAGLTMAEAVALAARIHAIYETGAEAFSQGEPWYQAYVDYALAEDLIAVPPDDYTRPAKRWEFAMLMSAALPADALPPIGIVLVGCIPDVTGEELFGPAVYRLYRAGVLSGSDWTGRFQPYAGIQRGEVAAIISRLCDPTQRKPNNLQKTTMSLYAADGRSKNVPFAEVEANLAVGWYRSTADALNANPWSVLSPEGDGSSQGICYAKGHSYGDLDKYCFDYTQRKPCTRAEVSPSVTNIKQGAFHESAFSAKLIRIGIPPTVVNVELNAFGGSTEFLSNLSIFCEPGSAGDVAAQWAGIKRVPARPVYSPIQAVCCMVTDEERPFYLKAGWCDTKEEAIAILEKKRDETFAQMLALADPHLSTGDYSGAMAIYKAILDDYPDTPSITPKTSELQRSTADRWRNSIACPIGVGNYWVSYNRVGMPEITLQLWNLSYAYITAFKFTFDCYDVFGSPACEPLSRNYTFSGYSDSEHLAPLDYTLGTWTLYRQGNTKTIQNVRITQIMFSDGASWRA